MNNAEAYMITFSIRFKYSKISELAKKQDFSFANNFVKPELVVVLVIAIPISSKCLLTESLNAGDFPVPGGPTNIEYKFNGN